MVHQFSVRDEKCFFPPIIIILDHNTRRALVVCALCVYFISYVHLSRVMCDTYHQKRLSSMKWYTTHSLAQIWLFFNSQRSFSLYSPSSQLHKLRFENYWRLMCAWQRVRKHFRWISFGTSIKQRPRTPSADNFRECWLRKIDQSQSNLKWIALILGSSFENIDKFQSNERMVRSSDRQSGLWISHQIIIINAYT